MREAVKDLVSLARQALDELRATRQAMEGLRRDLKRRDDRDRSERREAEIVVLDAERRRIG